MLINGVVSKYFPHKMRVIEMGFSERLLTWHSLWKITSGIISCRTCLGKQKEADQGQAFQHSGGCSCAKQVTFPWDDLDKIETGFAH